ncbi:hypothetical protein GCM10012284_07070 [Mangrovihabitans endophyticus]|uniref:Uncharacterized protein n=1 Tax=Mangrovihabitans endophyticus TaxID=1751298 RepID=A0A8J3BTI7_9ACTN|nr:hypothetical protein GCM10012284_07070 [Mangrovihabitans endophyticus]
MGDLRRVPHERPATVGRERLGHAEPPSTAGREHHRDYIHAGAVRVHARSVRAAGPVRAAAAPGPVAAYC